MALSLTGRFKTIACVSFKQLGSWSWTFSNTLSDKILKGPDNENWRLPYFQLPKVSTNRLLNWYQHLLFFHNAKSKQPVQQ